MTPIQIHPLLFGLLLVLNALAAVEAFKWNERRKHRKFIRAMFDYFFSGKKEAPWRSGWVTCEMCNHTHMSVWPATAERQECPACGHMTQSPPTADSTEEDTL